MADSPERAGAEPYQVVARRFRPRTFGEVVGQEPILNSLRASLKSGKIPHAYLFAGSRGVGKTTLARILARCLNCEQGPTPEPCGTCELCRSILDGSNTDVVEIDAASNNGVDDVRVLRESVGFAAMRSRYKVYILDEVHMLSKPAFNALLKTLEEPPPNVVFVLATTELHKVLETIRSRCQVLLFRRVGEPDIVERLRMIAAQDGVNLPDEVLEEIATQSRGGMRDAETALERVLPVARDAGGTLDLAAYRGLVQRVGADRAVEVATALLAGQPGPALHFAAELRQSGVDEREALGELIEVLRWSLLLKVDGADTALVTAGGALRPRLQALADAAEAHALEAAIQAGVLGRDRLRRLDDRAAVVELTLVRMAQAGRLPTLAALLAEVRGGGLPGPQAVALPAAKAQAAAGAPPPVPGAPARDDGLRAAALARLGNSHQLLRATLELCQVRGPDGQGRIAVRLDTERQMHKDRLASPGVQQEIKALFEGALGQPCALSFEIAGQGTPPPRGTGTGAPAAGTAIPPPTEAANRVLGRFGGRVVAHNPEDRRRPEPAPADATETPPDDPDQQP